MGLVLGVDVAAEGRLGAVEGADAGSRAARLRRKSRSRVKPNRALVGSRTGCVIAADGMKDLEDERVRIDQVESSGCVGPTT